MRSFEEWRTAIRESIGPKGRIKKFCGPILHEETAMNRWIPYKWISSWIYAWDVILKMNFSIVGITLRRRSMVRRKGGRSVVLFNCRSVKLWKITAVQPFSHYSQCDFKLYNFFTAVETFLPCLLPLVASQYTGCSTMSGTTRVW